MKRTMMQMYVRDSVAAVETYRLAFDAEILCVYPDGQGGYMHSEIDAYGQILAVSEHTGECSFASISAKAVKRRSEKPMRC